MKNVKNNNKGFSLVELIVVVLIMAILAVALAPQVMKWVENSRQATDLQTADAVVSAAQLAMATSGTKPTDDLILEDEVDLSGESDFWKNEVSKQLGTSTIKMKSDLVITISITSGGAITSTVAGDLSDDIK